MTKFPFHDLSCPRAAGFADPCTCGAEPQHPEGRSVWAWKLRQIADTLSKLPDSPQQWLDGHTLEKLADQLDAMCAALAAKEKP